MHALRCPDGGTRILLVTHMRPLPRFAKQAEGHLAGDTVRLSEIPLVASAGSQTKSCLLGIGMLGFGSFEGQVMQVICPDA